MAVNSREFGLSVLVCSLCLIERYKNPDLGIPLKVNLVIDKLLVLN